MGAQDLIGIAPAAAQMVGYLVTAALIAPLYGMAIVAINARRRLAL